MQRALPSAQVILYLSHAKRTKIHTYLHIELVWQLRNWTGERQVPNVKYALQHNVGLGGAVVVTIYKKANANQSKPRLGYNPAIEARPITKEEYDKAASQTKNRSAFFESKL